MMILPHLTTLALANCSFTDHTEINNDQSSMSFRPAAEKTPCKVPRTIFLRGDSDSASSPAGWLLLSEPPKFANFSARECCEAALSISQSLLKPIGAIKIEN